LSCNQDDVTPSTPVNTPSTPSSNGLDGDWQEMYTQYITYDGPNHLVSNVSNPVYNLLQGNLDSKVRLTQNFAYTVYMNSQSAMGKYTNDYFIVNSTPNDTLFWTSKTSTQLVCETRPVTPTNSYTTVRITLIK
jgi:hypothetical protein